MFVFFNCFNAIANKPQIDSLKHAIVSEKNISAKISLITDLLAALSDSKTLETYNYAEQLIRVATTAKDSDGIGTGHYYLAANHLDFLRLNEAMEEAKIAEVFLKNTKQRKLLAGCYNVIGNVAEFLGKSNLAKIYMLRAVAICYRIGDNKSVAAILGNLGNIEQNLGNNYGALKYYFEALKTGEKLKNNNSVLATTNVNIGYTYFRLDKYDKALPYFKKSLSYALQENDSSGIAYAMMFLGHIAAEKGQDTVAENYYRKSLSISLSIKDSAQLADCYNSLGAIVYDRGDIKEALDYFYKSLKINSRLDFAFSLTGDYIEIGKCQLALKEYEKALGSFKKSVEYGLLSENLENIESCYSYLATTYEKINDYKNAYKYHKLFKASSDSMANNSKLEKLTEVQLTYQFEKQTQAAQLEQAKKDAVKEEELKRQRFLIYIAILILIVIGIFAFFLFKANARNKRAKELLSAQKKQIEQTNEELNQQNEEIAAQRDEIENQKFKVEEQHKEIKDSILYAKRIQQALLTSEDYISQYLSEYFLLFRPKDIVSGDFYWMYSPTVQNTDSNQILFAAADCTGHGVPGAFMSMMGVNFLNEIVVEKKIARPDLILNTLRRMIIDALNPRGSDGNSKDGMDIVLCSLNQKTLQLDFAAANNSLYIVRRLGEEKSNRIPEFELMEYKADKFPVGKYNEIDKDFTLRTVQLQKGDLVYLFSDGYADQFGGYQGKKFKYRQLQDLFTTIADKPMENQKQILNDVFVNWRHDHEQVDDVLIIGIRV